MGLPWCWWGLVGWLVGWGVASGLVVWELLGCFWCLGWLVGWLLGGVFLRALICVLDLLVLLVMICVVFG